MSIVNCEACSELRENAPNFVQNGVDSTVEMSILNNTGLNPVRAVASTNCEDLKLVNDCLIGRLGQEVESLDVCDWKDYMSRFVPNLYEELKAMILAECSLDLRVSSICELVMSTFTPTVRRAVVYANDYTALNPSAVSYGHLTNAIYLPSLGEGIRKEVYSPFFGITYTYDEYVGCAGSGSMRLFSFVPSMYQARAGSGLTYGAVAWYITYAECVAAMGDTIANYLFSHLILMGDDGVRFNNSYTYYNMSSGSNFKRLRWVISGDIGGVVTGAGQDAICIRYVGSDQPEPLEKVPEGTTLSADMDGLNNRVVL